MGRRTVLWLVAVALVVGSAVLWHRAFLRPVSAAGETVSITLPSITFHLAPGPHVEEVEAFCSTCHSLRYILMQPPLSRAVWTAEVDKMIHVFGATIPPDKVPEIVDYLASHYGPEP